MTDRNPPIERELLEILEEAIREEKASAERYRRGLELSTEPEIRALFEKLAADEAVHERVLKERYYAIKKQLGLKVVREDEE